MTEMIGVIGPGKAFGQELIDSLHQEDVRVAVFARNVRWKDLADVFVEADLESDVDHVVQCIAQYGINRVIYSARSGKAKDESDVPGIWQDIKTGALSAEIIYQQLKELHGSDSDRFVVVGGDFGDSPNSKYPGLSREKAVLHNFARSHFEDTPPTHLAIIEGAVATGRVRQKVAHEITRLALADSVEHETRINCLNLQ